MLLLAGSPRIRSSLTTRPLAALARLFRREAATMAYCDALWLMAVLSLGARIFVSLVRTQRRSAPTATAEAN